MATPAQSTLFQDKHQVQAETPQTLTTSEAAARLRLTQRHTQKLAAHGTLEAVKDGKQWLISTAAVARYIGRRSGGQAPEASVGDVPSETPSGTQSLTDLPGPSLLQHLAGVEQQLQAALGREQRLLRLLETVLRVPLEPARVPITPPSHPLKEPDPGTLQGRILTYLRANEGKAKWAHQVQRDLDLARSPSRELSKLLARGLVQKQKPGLYVATPLAPAGE